MILATITAFAFFAILASPSAPSIAVADVRNETGNPRFDPLARASGELIVGVIDFRHMCIASP